MDEMHGSMRVCRDQSGGIGSGLPSLDQNEHVPILVASLAAARLR